MSDFAPEWSSEGDTLVFGQEPKLADGVRGCAFDMPNGIYISLITAEVEGDGRVGKFLDSLPRDRRVVFPNVVSGRLAGMLLRRGFEPAYEQSEPGLFIDVMERS